VADIFWSALAIDRHDLKLPLDRRGRQQKTNLAVARLVFEVSLDRDFPPALSTLLNSAMEFTFSSCRIRNAPSKTGTRSLMAGRYKILAEG
jgi:hypothetical protein